MTTLLLTWVVLLAGLLLGELLIRLFPEQIDWLCDLVSGDRGDRHV